MSHSLMDYLIGGFLGLMLHLFMKIIHFKNQGKRANHPFVFKDYINDDWAVLCADVITLFIVIFCIDEFLPLLPPKTVDYIKWLFVFVGYSGSSLLIGALSVTAKKYDQIFDFKSNVADGKVPPQDAGNIEGALVTAKDDAAKEGVE